MQPNRATIYSNGIADFQRVFTVSGSKTNRISIPFRQQHLGDVLASLTISGLVEIESPPSFQPANQDDGSIKLSTENAIIELAHQLAGADVAIRFGNAILEGKLVGVQDHEEATGGEPVTGRSIVVMNQEGFSRVPVNQIEVLKFLEDSIQTEIDKALSRRLRDIKPNSTFIDLELTTKEPSTEAVIQYTIPAAAWKISYRVLLHDDASIEFHGHAIVDNNTDEDWRDFVIAVVMGQPISFTNDLADSKTPRRSHVNVVQESAVGAIEIEETEMAFDRVREPEPLYQASYESPPEQAQPFRKNLMKTASVTRRVGSAAVQEAGITETGDFCIFESANPVSIAAHRSAIIPVFATTLAETRPVLHYQTDNHAERPFRALRFKNTTTHSLGRGICTVYDGTTYAGSCILPATKPGGDSLLPHALETAVKVVAKLHEIKSQRNRIRVSEGVVYESYHKTATTEYHIRSSRNEPFQFLLDHDNRLRESKTDVQLNRDNEIPVSLETEDLKNGRRVVFDLRANDRLELCIVQSTVTQSRTRLTGNNADEGKSKIGWLHENLIESNTSLADDPAIRNCIAIQKQIDETDQRILQTTAEIERLGNRQQRLRENIKTGGVAQQTVRWQADLGNAEDQIVQLEEEQLPRLNAELKEAHHRLFEALRNLVLEWNE